MAGRALESTVDAEEKNTGLSGGAETRASYCLSCSPSRSKNWRSRLESSDGLSGESSPSHGADAGLRPSVRRYLEVIRKPIFNGVYKTNGSPNFNNLSIDI